jgi:hypothetical protein
LPYDTAQSSGQDRVWSAPRNVGCKMPWSSSSSVRERISSQNTYPRQGASVQKSAYRELKVRKEERASNGLNFRPVCLATPWQAGPRFSICASSRKWDWKYGPNKRQKRSKTPISRENLPYLLYPCLPGLLRLLYFQHAAPYP